ncbi:dna polymerase delta catalytic subunit-like [Stylonychia lemnae]|uniref:DNA polymerase n=1 Tax=Stylonychia lemnae TaxID=5949 RepID=A0A078B887_STYLE|nr:dna polymerase delta catalytic subunit-like [Stylonychia lemnae]|eukprot:CDW90396.1 dna polymerase delta catalytic subunit-like [Stylonychia lemnae]
MEHRYSAYKSENEFEDAPEFLKGPDLSGRQNVRRPPCPSINPNTQNIEFMQIDVDYYTDLPLSMKNQQSQYMSEDQSKEREKEEKAVIRMFGITQQGNSVMCHVHNFTSYFYVEYLPHVHQLTPIDLERIKNELNNLENGAKMVMSIEMIKKSTVMHYQENQKTFLKIYTRLPRHVNLLRTKFENRHYVFSQKEDLFQQITFESNLPYALRFMIDNEIVGMSWIRVDEGKYKIRSQNFKITNAQIEIDVENFNDIQCLPCEGDYQNLAPLRILSFDIECSAEKGRFPLAQQDPIIQIANIVKIQGEKEPFVRNVFTLQECAPIVGSQVNSYKSEQKMLEAWRDFLVEVDPDIITGYNIVNFDFPYIINRAQALQMNKYAKFSRILDSVSKIKSNTFSSKALGTRETKDINIEGRVQFDMLQVILREHKLRSYSLNSVSAQFLGEQKEDVHHSIISDLQNKNEFTRRRLAVYCLKDAYLPLRLMEKLMCLFNLTEMSRVTGVPISYLFTRGQQIKVSSQLYRKAKEYDLVIPVDKGAPMEGKYEGAVVIEPTRGFYTDPVATLDFASLYPSIMMAHNLCYSTLIPNNRVKNYNPEMYVKTPNGDYFMKQTVKKGLLPMILEELISARKRARQELAKATDPFVKAVLDGRQLALKISANSVYGFTGAQVGQLPCLAISSSVTAYGREMIEATRAYVLNKYCKKNGYEFDSQVIYGDTDSVMVKFGVESITEAMKLGQEAASYVSQFFEHPIKLEFEKVYCPYLLMNKKRYAGLLWTKPDKYDKIDAKGIETVRRDNCGLVKEAVQKSLDLLLINKDKDKALDFCKGIISDLLQNRIDLSLLVITKGLGKKTSKPETDDKSNKPQGSTNQSYHGKQAHVELAERMRKRDEASAPSQGDRIAYVMIKAAKGSKGYEKSEDPLYVLQHNLAIDFQFYLDHQIKLPLLRLFEPVFSNAEQLLFQGEHTRAIYIPKVGNTMTGLGKFAVVKKQCLGCKNVMGNNDDDCVCKNCQPKKKQIYIERKQELNLYEKTYADLWVQCQRCQGSLHEDILCTSRDCPIFYRRLKAKKNLEENQEILAGFLDW